jgi:hypothetical protein
MSELQADLGVRWDDHSRETSIRFFKQARSLYGRAPRYDQLDLNDLEEERYAREMAARRTEDKVVWSHRDNIRAEEYRQQAYESSLDSLGLKILNRRLHRDYAERQRIQKTREAHELNKRMRDEMIKQEERAAKLQEERDEMRRREEEKLRKQVAEKLAKYPVKEKNERVGYVVSVDDVEEVDSFEMLGGGGSGCSEEDEDDARWYGGLTEKSRDDIVREERRMTMPSTVEEVVEEDDDDDILDQDDLRRMRQKCQYRSEKHFDENDS